MKYRRFGKLNWEASVLGFGAMRLPTLDGDYNRVNEPEAIRMIRYAVDHGVNYIDTAYPYHGGNSEVVVGKALKDGYRDKVRIATKMPIGRVSKPEELDEIFNEQLRRLQLDYVDFYLLHGLNRDGWRKTLDLNALDWAERQIAEGRIRHFGFSFHDEFEVFKEIIDGYSGWTFCQIQYNYVDNESSVRTPGTIGLKYAASRGLAVVVMEPIKGGLLAVTPPKEVQAIWDEAEVKRSPAEWALLWVWNHPEVSVALSGMSTMEQVIENIRIADRSAPNILTPKELEIITRVKEKYLQHGFVGCTGCRYCMPCPQGVRIPDILAFLNMALRADEPQRREVIDRYNAAIPQENRAETCIRCGTCESKCPQNLPIRKLLSDARWVLRAPP
ncbi:MAG: aldo/keto reductase [Candidatus Bathyarchaeia archaeon]|nr:aldo/keto reductase [Candidatus Bathyarchaeota archaeon]